MDTSTTSRLAVEASNAIENFDDLAKRFAGYKLAIFLDYDGTLTPIVSDPSAARITPEARASVERLSELFITGVITGRSLEKIQEFMNIPQLYYAGSHGFDIAGPNGTPLKNQVAADFLPDLAGLRDDLREGVKDIENAEVEDNLFSISLHYRNVDEALHDKIAEIASSVAEKYPKIRFNQGKMVHEFKPKIDWHKGAALKWLLSALEVEDTSNVFTIYIGDDTTDEDAFRVLRSPDDPSHQGVGIVVTDTSKDTAASYTLKDCEQVHEFLQRLIAHGESL